MLAFERRAWQQGYRRVAGVDEVGRGPLAGPVIAVALVFDRVYLEAEAGGRLAGVDDSKRLSPSAREALYAFLVSSPHVSFGTGRADPEEIDRLNILRATHEAMRRALAALAPPADHALVDGLPVPGLPCASAAIVRGDSRSLSVAAASIVAKVIRDRMMCEMDRQYASYGFAQHKGYGTRGHMSALLEHGPCPIHRRSFQPVRDALAIRGRMAETDGDVA